MDSSVIARAIGSLQAFPRRLKLAAAWRVPRAFRIFICCICAFLLSTTWAALATTSVYDPNGRLVAVTNDAGNSARYTYDEMGNLKKVERLASTDLAIFGFAPGRGGPGVSVKIFGHGLSATPSQDVVKFNGVLASVSSASTTELVAVVPVGAATGPISVRVGVKVATSANDFVVDPNIKPPAITNVSPLIATVGTAITVDGQNMAPVANQTTTRLNITSAVTTLTSNAQIQFPVPPGAGSGKVSVSTPYGTAVSTQDVMVAPSGVLTSTIDQVKRLTVDATPQGFAVPTSGHYAAALFDGGHGDYFTAQFTAISSGSITYTLYGTNNLAIASGSVSASHPTLLLPKLPVTGTYLLLMKPSAAGVTWNIAIERDESLAITDVPTTTVNAYVRRFTFVSTPGQNLGLGISELTSANSSKLYVYRPDGSQLTYETCSPSYEGCDVDLPNLPAGTYSAVLLPDSGTASFEITLSKDIGATLTSGTTYPLSLSRPGQDGRLTFDGVAGQTLALNIAGVSTVPASNYVYYTIYNPDGSVLAGQSSTMTELIFNQQSLPQSGTYTVWIDPYFGATATAQVSLVLGTPGSLSTSGGSNSYSTTLKNQNVYLNFTATSGQSLGLGISELSGAARVDVHVYRFDGSELAYNGNCFIPGCDIDLPNLLAGTYSIVMVPYSGPISFKATLSEDITSTLTPGIPYSLTLARPGQDGRLQFNGTAGEYIGLSIGGVTTIPASSSIHYTIYKPDGSSWTTAQSAASSMLNLEVLPSSGNYTVWIDPDNGATAALQLMLLPAVGGTVSTTGGSGTYATTIPNQKIYLNFTATTGQNLGLGLSELTSTPTTGLPYFQIYVYRSDGSQLTYASCNAGFEGCDVDLPNLAAGNYSVVVEPPDSRTMSFKATLSENVTAALTPGVASPLTLNRRGQDGRVQFNGTAGQSIALSFSNVATTPAGNYVYYTVYKPDGSILSPQPLASNSAGALTLNFPKLPVTGTYTALIDPNYAAALTEQVTLLSAVSGTVSTTGGSGAFSTTGYGQKIYLSFVASDGQNLGFGLSNLAGSATSLTVDVRRPDGSYVPNSITCVIARGGCDVDLAKLMAGTYSIEITPNTGTMSFNATLSSDVTASLVPSIPYGLSLSRPGQDARLQFNGTAGQQLAINMASVVTTPADGAATYAIYKPDGSLLSQTHTSGDLTLNVKSLPMDGTYTLWIDPDYAATMTTQVALLPPVTGTISVSGGGATFSTSGAGQSAYLSFTATAGQNLGLGISERTTGSATVYVYRPDGSLQDSTYCYSPNSDCDLDLPNLVTGAYSVVVTPDADPMSFKATLSVDVATTLTSGSSYALSLSKPGQDARLQFNGTVGQTVAVSITNPSSKYVDYFVYKPDGGVLTSLTSMPGDAVLNLGSLPVSGTYTLWVDPFEAATVAEQIVQNGATGTPTDPPGPLGPAVSVGSAPVTLSNAAPDQSAAFNFTATSGQNLGIGITDMVGDPAYVYVNRLDGSQVTYQYCNSACDLELPSLAAGTYNVIVTPVSGMLSLKATLSADVTATLVAGTPYALTLSRSGQDGRLQFSGTTGTTIVVQVTGQLTTPSSKAVYYTVYNPDGSVWTSSSGYGSALTMNLKNLPQTGLYTIAIDPDNAAVASAQIKIFTDTASTLITGGAAVTYTTAVQDEAAYFNFTATAGQNLGLGISELAATATSATVHVYRTDGSELMYQSCSQQNEGCDLDLPNLIAGTYSVVVQPNSGGALGFKATLSQEISSSLITGTPYLLSLSRRGQDGRLQFSGTMGSTMALQVTGQSTSPSARAMYYTVYKPDGSIWTSSSSSGSALTMNLNNLPATGTYTVFVDPNYAATADAQIKVFVGAASTLTTTGAPVSFSAAAPDQAAYFSFNASAGQNLGLGISEYAGSGSTVYIYYSNGIELTHKSCGGSGCDFNLPNTAAGNYSVVVQPSAGGTPSFKATLSEDVLVSMTSGTPLSVTTNRPGQNVRLLFSKTVPGKMMFRYDDQSIPPLSGNLYYTLYRPDGSQVTTFLFIGASLTYGLSDLPASGTYTILLDPGIKAFNGQVQVVAGTEATLIANGASVGYTTMVPDQSAYFNFTASQGQNLGLGISALTGTVGLDISVYRADGTQLKHGSCSPSLQGCDLDLPNMAAGSYTVTIGSDDPDGTWSFIATLSEDAVGTVTSGVPYSLSLIRPGQDGRLQFDAIAGRPVYLSISSLATNPTGKGYMYRVLKPDGSNLTYPTNQNGSLELLITPMASGVHTLLLDPADGATLSAQVTLQ